MSSPQNNITIIDAIMGTGKSLYAINNIITQENKHYLCVLPTNDECERYASSSICEVFYTDDHKKRKGTKTEYFKQLVKENKSIATTHYLIEHLDQEIINLLREKKYVLVIDECLDVLHKLADLKKSDVKLLFNDNWISITKNGLIQWNADKDMNYDGVFKRIKDMCDMHSLIAMRLQEGDFSKEYLMWQFPCEFFELFQESYVLTYMWDGSIQKSYFDLHNIKYKHMTLNNERKLMPYDKSYELVKRKQFKELISIHEGSENIIGNKKGKTNPLSKSWYDKNSKNENKDVLTVLKKATYNYFHNIKKSPSNENMYTTFIGFEKYVKGKGYTKGFVPCNSKGTNDFKDKSVLAYLINFFMPVEIERFFKGYGISIKYDLMSLSEFVQWIWRSRIRENHPISIYVPSQRMRELLIQWLDGEI